MFESVSRLKAKGGKDEKGNDRIHTYLCESGTPYGEAYDALGAMRNFILQKMNENEEQEKPKGSADIEICGDCAVEEKKEEVVSDQPA